MLYKKADFRQLLGQFRLANPGAEEKELVKAEKMIRKSLMERERRDGETAYQHSLNTASLAAQIGFDPETILSALLHNALDHGEIEGREIASKFSPEIAALVEEVTKTNQIISRNRENVSPGTLSKVVLSASRDIRALLILLCDKVENMRSLEGLSGEEQVKKASLVLSLFVPISHKLGLNEIKWELQDLAMKVLNPEAYFELKEMLGKKREDREKWLAELINEIRGMLEKKKIKATIYGRIKNFYGTHQKMLKKNKPIEEINDLTAVRIICDTEKDCYSVLGALNQHYTPLKGGFDDYIVRPKPNGYRSIHSDFRKKNGDVFEAQIRTWKMHAEAEGGAAAHWAYKEYEKDKDFDKKLSWAKQLVEWGRSSLESKEFLNSIKLDFGRKKIFVFTPKGEVVELEEFSTPVDFAYSIHSEIGNRALKAKVNGMLVSLDAVLKDGDTVEIITSQKQSPRRSWLHFVKTSKARQKIKSSLEFRGIKRKIKEKLPSTKRQIKKRRQESIKLSKCCNPVPGDEIIAYHTTKRKITVHKKGCQNVKKIAIKNRFFELDWGIVGKKDFRVAVKVKARDRPSLLTDLLKAISKGNAGLVSTNAKVENNVAMCEFLVEIKDQLQLELLLKSLGKVKGTMEVKKA